ncbi:MAG: hypothetical protein WD226_01880 [Planctomycetota bacterium]
MLQSQNVAFAAIALFTCLPVVQAQDDYDGFARTALARPVEPHAALPNGELLGFDGVALTRYDAALNPLSVVAIPPDPIYSVAFPSFVTVSPDGLQAFVGRTACNASFTDCDFGDLWSIDLATGAANFEGLLSGNFDGAFADGTTAFVSAKPCGFSCPHASVYRVALGSGALTEIVEIPGASGPVAVDVAGNLIVGTASDLFPPPAGASSVLLFPAADVTGGLLLTPADGFVLASGLEGATRLAVDRLTGDLFLAANRYEPDAMGNDATVNRVYLLEGGESTVVFAGEPGWTLGNLEVEGGDGTARLFPYQPSTGGALRFRAVDYFAGISHFREYVPARPELTATALGGTAQLALAGAGDDNAVFLFLAPASASLATEVPLQLPAVLHAPLFLGLDPGLAVLDPAPLFTDGNGEAARNYAIPAGLPSGVYAAQGVLFSLSARALGTTTVAIL